LLEAWLTISVTSIDLLLEFSHAPGFFIVLDNSSHILAHHLLFREAQMLHQDVNAVYISIYIEEAEGDQGILVDLDHATKPGRILRIYTNNV